MKYINVLHVLASNSFGGAENIVMQICENLDNKLFKFFVVCNGGSLKELFEKKGFCVFTQNAGRPSFRSLKELNNIILQHNINIIHAHDNKASIYSFICKKLYSLDIKIISHVHSSYPWLKHFGIYRILDGLFRNNYDTNIFCGNNVLAHYKKYATINNDKAIVVKNSIKVSPVRNAENLKHIRYDLGLSDSDFVCFFAGRLAPPKGLIPFLEKLLPQKELLQNIKFVIIGEGELSSQIEHFVKLNNMANAVLLIGYKENILDYISTFDVLILPSIYEGLPLVILEAMSQAKPVIAFDVGSIGEIFQTNPSLSFVEIQNLPPMTNTSTINNSSLETPSKDVLNSEKSEEITNCGKVIEFNDINDSSKIGFLIDQFNYETMFNKIKLLKNNIGLSKRMGENGFDLFQNHFKINIFVEKIKSTYLE